MKQADRPIKKAPEIRLRILLLLLGIAVGLLLSRIVFSNKPTQPSFIAQASPVITDLDKYSPKHFSQDNEDIIIRHFFKDQQGGFFLDVGAFHYKKWSNTFYLEKFLGWDGIAIDANPETAAGYKKYRPKTIFFNVFISDKSDEDIDFYIVQDTKHPGMSTGNPGFINGMKSKKIKVPTITLNDLLAKLDIKKIDFLNMDIELWEPQALAGFDIERYKPDLVCIEAHRQVRDQILAYFIEHGYARMDLYFLFDQRNWYFTPKDQFRQKFDVDY